MISNEFDKIKLRR